MFSSSEKQFYDWDKIRNKVYSSVGKWIGGKTVFVRDKNLFDDFFDKKSYFQLYFYSITGREMSSEFSIWLENNFMCTSYPDQRIWCNQIGSLSGGTKVSPVAGVVSGILSSDSRAYGCQTTFRCMNFLKDLKVKKDAGFDVFEYIKSVPKKNGLPSIPGFIRPVNVQDERIPHLEKMTTRLGFEVGEYMSLANEVSSYMIAEYDSGMNIGGFTSAFFLDRGLSPQEGYQLKSMSVASGVMACFVGERTKNSENGFLPFHCSDIEYVGPAIKGIVVDKSW